MGCAYLICFSMCQSQWPWIWKGFFMWHAFNITHVKILSGKIRWQCVGILWNLTYLWIELHILVRTRNCFSFGIRICILVFDWVSLQFCDICISFHHHQCLSNYPRSPPYFSPVLLIYYQSPDLWSIWKKSIHSLPFFATGSEALFLWVYQWGNISK